MTEENKPAVRLAAGSRVKFTTVGRGVSTEREGVLQKDVLEGSKDRAFVIGDPSGQEIDNAVISALSESVNREDFTAADMGKHLKVSRPHAKHVTAA